MDSGKFLTVNKPFAFHTCIRTSLLSAQVETEAKRLKLIIDLDERIDQATRQAMKMAQAQEGTGDPRRSGEEKRDGSEKVGEGDADDEEGEGLVMGDEMRLRQIVSK